MTFVWLRFGSIQASRDQRQKLLVLDEWAVGCKLPFIMLRNQEYGIITVHSGYTITLGGGFANFDHRANSSSMNTSSQFVPPAMDRKDPLGGGRTVSIPLVQNSRRTSQQELAVVEPPPQLEFQHLREVSD